MKKIILVCLAVLLFPCVAKAVPESWANHVVISEIQIAGVSSTDEFVELYNPTNQAVSLKNWRLSRKTAAGNLSNLLTTFPDVSLPPYSYFLIVHPSGYKGSVLGDAFYSTSSSIANDNTVILFSDAGLTVVDKVGLGAASDKEGTAVGNPPSSQSVERKPGELDPFHGNGQDTDDNSVDFSLRQNPEPQNLTSAAEAPLAENNLPQLSFVKQDGYQTDGVAPDFGLVGEEFTFKVNYEDQENNLPRAGYPKVWIDLSQDGVLDENEWFSMEEEDLLDNDCRDGKVYIYTKKFDYAGEDYQYKFAALEDLSGNWATGEATGILSGPKVTAENQPPSVELSGVEQGKFYSRQIELGWTISDESGQSHFISLYFSADGQNWTKIFENQKDVFEYEWDISPLNNGVYQLKLIVADDGTPPMSSAILSEKFNVQNFKQGDLIINEVEYDPVQTGTDSDYEWVEIWNALSSSVTLLGWQICDNSLCKQIPQAKLAAGSYLVVASKQNGFLINYPNFSGNVVYLEDEIGNGLANSGDSIKLMDEKGNLIDALAYAGASKAGFSWARKSDGTWQFTKEKTPGEENLFGEEDWKETPPPTPRPTPLEEVTVTDLENVRNLPEGTLVTLEGIVSVEPGVFGNQIIYIQGSPGLQIYLYSGDFPALTVGDKIKVVGELSDYFGERRLKARTASDFSVLSSGNLVEIIPLDFSQIGEAYEGHLVYLSGKYSRKSGSSVYITDGFSEIKIYLKESTGITLPGLSANDIIEVRGVLSQTESGYRILPRYQSDIKVTKGQVDKTVKTSKVSVKKASGTTKTKTAKPTAKVLQDFEEIPENTNNPLDWKMFLLIGGIMLGVFGAWWFFFREKSSE